MAVIKISERMEKSSYITYLYNAVAASLAKVGGRGELCFGETRAELTVTLDRAEREVRRYLEEKIAEIVGIGYKADLFGEKLKVCLGAREKRILTAALIAADLEGDCAFIRRKLAGSEIYSIDGFYRFRLTALTEKWRRILDCIPEGFSSPDLKRFCDYLVGESKRKIYVKGNAVFGENFLPLRRSRLMGEEDLETEIVLSDAGFVYCLGKIDPFLEDFLQKYYAERAVFS